MKHRIIIASFAICLIMISTGCSDAPYHTVIENGNMVIYHAEKMKDQKVGTFEYWVRDNSSKGWRLITDKKFKVGDILTITK